MSASLRECRPHRRRFPPPEGSKGRCLWRELSSRNYQRSSELRDVIELFDILDGVDQPLQFFLAKYMTGQISCLLFQLQWAHRVVWSAFEVNHQHRRTPPVPE